MGSDLRDHITLAVLQLRERNELHALQKRWWYDKGDNCDKESSKTKQDTTNALKLLNVAGIFYILIGGLILAITMAALEFFYRAKVESKKRKVNFQEYLINLQSSCH